MLGCFGVGLVHFWVIFVFCFCVATLVCDLFLCYYFSMLSHVLSCMCLV